MRVPMLRSGGEKGQNRRRRMRMRMGHICHGTGDTERSVDDFDVHEDRHDYCACRRCRYDALGMVSDPSDDDPEEELVTFWGRFHLVIARLCTFYPPTSALFEHHHFTPYQSSSRS